MQAKTSATPAATKWPLAGLSLLLVIATLASYWPVYSAGFIAFDDSHYVVDNPHVKSGVSARNVYWALTRYHADNWHPLTWISHMFDVDLFGLDARGHHAVNAALHAVNVVLLLWLLVSLTGRIGPSFVVALLFAVHPVNVESVAWVSQRKTVLSTLFGILAIWSYAKYAKLNRDRRWYAASLGWYLLSLMSKQMLVTLPFALLLLDYWPLERRELAPDNGQPLTWRELARGWWRLFPEKVPYLLMAVAVSVITLIVQDEAMRSVDSYPVGYRLGNVSIAYVRYLISLVWPARLAVFYPLFLFDITLPKVAASLALLLAISVGMTYFGLRRRYLLVGWFWYLGTMIPVVGLVHVGLQSMADRYAYLTFWGLFIILAWGASDLLAWLGPSKGARTAIAVGTVLLGAGLMYRCYRQAEHWQSTITLFEDAAANTRFNWQAQVLLVDEYINRGDYRRALEYCEAAEPWTKGMGDVMANHGLALIALGSRDEGLKKLEQAAAADPEESSIRVNLGVFYLQDDRMEDAIAQFAQADKHLNWQDDAEIRLALYTNWASALRRVGRHAESRERYRQALGVGGRPANVLRDLGGVELELGNIPEALIQLRQAAAIAPDDLRTHYLLGMACQASGDWPAAAVAFEQAAGLDPKNIDIAVRRANALLRAGRAAEATTVLEQILPIAQAADGRGESPVAAGAVLGELAGIQLATGKLTAAVQLYDRALAAWPDNYVANNNLAWILATSANESFRDGPRAVRLAEHACKLLGDPNSDALSTLAAAYAAAGEFAKAVETCEQAVQLATQAKQPTDGLTRQLARYREGSPYIEAGSN